MMHSSIVLRFAIVAVPVLMVACGSGAGGSDGLPDEQVDRTGQTGEMLTSGACVGTTTESAIELISCEDLPINGLQGFCTDANGCVAGSDELGNPTCEPQDFQDDSVSVPVTKAVSCGQFSVSVCPSQPGCSVSAPTSSLPAQFFFVNGTGYYANAQGHYCAFTSWPQWVAAHAPLAPFSGSNPGGYQVYGAIPSGLVSDGQCRLQAGFFFSGGTGYYANAAGHYCAFTSWPQWVAAHAPLAPFSGSNPSGYQVYGTIPDSMVYDGVCAG